MKEKLGSPPHPRLPNYTAHPRQWKFRVKSAPGPPPNPPPKPFPNPLPPPPERPKRSQNRSSSFTPPESNGCHWEFQGEANAHGVREGAGLQPSARPSAGGFKTCVKFKWSSGTVPRFNLSNYRIVGENHIRNQSKKSHAVRWTRVPERTKKRKVGTKLRYTPHPNQRASVGTARGVKVHTLTVHCNDPPQPERARIHSLNYSRWYIVTISCGPQRWTWLTFGTKTSSKKGARPKPNVDRDVMAGHRFFAVAWRGVACRSGSAGVSRRGVESKPVFKRLNEIPQSLPGIQFQVSGNSLTSTGQRISRRHTTARCCTALHGAARHCTAQVHGGVHCRAVPCTAVAGAMHRRGVVLAQPCIKHRDKFGTQSWTKTLTG
ncbi:hypothetical protein C8F04DRAFT_1195728 [Mycena alexandri]|uniref:Uncharacterized protein n=1 Tax=Mycena alexandri TaxID=1745969 RepID=A0AAD6S8N9_9AGAR|nr:hypothetical protein C8F04DRAFT_1195728 [Mycena alexandri]